MKFLQKLNESYLKGSKEPVIAHFISYFDALNYQIAIKATNREIKSKRYKLKNLWERLGYNEPESPYLKFKTDLNDDGKD